MERYSSKQEKESESLEDAFFSERLLPVRRKEAEESEAKTSFSRLNAEERGNGSGSRAHARATTMKKATTKEKTKPE